METIGCVFDKEHPGSLSIADAEDSVTALSTATLASEKPSTLHKKKTNVLSEKGRNNSLVLMMESCITLAGRQVSHCMLPVVITMTDCLLFYILLNEILLH